MAQPIGEAGERRSGWAAGALAVCGALAAAGAAIALMAPRKNRSNHLPAEGVRVHVQKTLETLMRREDTDRDKKITVDDIHRSHSKAGDLRFRFLSVDGKPYAITGLYYLANLLQELRLAQEAGEETALLDPAKIFDPPTDHMLRMIRGICWEGLTRRMDEKGLLKLLADEKTKTVDGCQYVYVPEEDQEAYEYYSKIASVHASQQIRVVKLPQTITPDVSHHLEGHHGILSLDIMKDAQGRTLPVPYVVPGGRFNEMYGWDSFFIVLGLLADGKDALARSMVDQQVYEIAHYGKILNANRTYYLTRSQPPFLTTMARAVYQTMPRTAASRTWLRTVIDAVIHVYRQLWMGPDHLMETGLSRYFDTATGPCPETEPGAYDDVYERFAERHNMGVEEFKDAYLNGRMKDSELDRYFVHDRAMRESGHDTSYRLVGRAADLATVDLNSLLYKIETDLALMIADEFGGTYRTSEGDEASAADFHARAARRKALVDRYLWDEKAGVYYDHDERTHERTGYLAATTFYPMWAGLASRRQARSLMQHALPLLEQCGGIAGSSERSRGALSKQRKERQWDYPNGWPPHQILLWQALKRYGYHRAARRLAYRWLYSMTLNAVQYNGTITEKLDVVRRTHDVFAEYGNVGTKFAYITREGFGWSNASFQLGIRLMTRGLREKLDRLIPPEWIFPE